MTGSHSRREASQGRREVGRGDGGAGGGGRRASGTRRGLQLDPTMTRGAKVTRGTYKEELERSVTFALPTFLFQSLTLYSA